MQFGPNEDFNHYPRTLDADLEKLEAIGCDLVYLPTASELYPEGLDKISKVQVTDLTDNYEGAHRPGHFTGVATVVLKLFNIVKPDVSVFGKKDYQQYRVISKMVEDLNLDVQIIGQETTRDASGLATSSRNQYLDDAQTDTAAMIYRQLQQTARAIDEGERDFAALEQRAIAALDARGVQNRLFQRLQCRNPAAGKPRGPRSRNPGHRRAGQNSSARQHRNLALVSVRAAGELYT